MITPRRIIISARGLWSLSAVAYIICSTAFGAGPLSFLNRITLFAFFGISVLNILFRNKCRLKINGCEIALTILAFILFVGCIWSPTEMSSVMGTLYDYITMLILVFCFTNYIRETSDVKKLVFAYLLAGLTMAVYVYSQYGSEFWTILRQNENVAKNNIARLGASITNTNSIGSYTCYSALIGCYYIFFTPISFFKKGLVSVVTLFCFIVSMATGSKKALVCIAVGIAVLFICKIINSDNAARKLKYMLLGIVSVIILVYLIFTLPIFSGIASRFNTYLNFRNGVGGGSSDIERDYLTKTGIAVWLDHPIIGEGTYASAFHFGFYAHNNIVELLMNNGLIGCITFYSFIVAAIIKYGKNIKIWLKTDSVIVPLAALFLCVLVCSTSFVYYYERYYMILLSIVYAAIKPLQEDIIHV